MNNSRKDDRMDELEVRSVNFQGSSLLAIQDKITGKIFTAINNVLRGLGFDEKQIEYQRDKWVDDKAIMKGTQKFSGTLLGAGTGKETWCIDIMKLPLALAKINITPKIKIEMPELAERLEIYQDRCADALAREFNIYGSTRENEYKLPCTYKEALQQLLITVTEKEELETTVKVKEQQITEMEPKVIFADAVAASDDTILVGELAKLICQNGYDIGEKRLYEWLRNNGYLIKGDRADRNLPTQRSMDMKLFVVRKSVRINADGISRVDKVTRVTGKGQQYLINKFSEMGQQKFCL